MDAVRARWATSNYPIPKALWGYYDGKYYLTCSDNETIYYFASKKGKIYVATRNKCTLTKAGDEDVYFITPCALQEITCKRPTRAVDEFVVGTLLPLIPMT